MHNSGKSLRRNFLKQSYQREIQPLQEATKRLADEN
jgi:hypothetical protein